MVNKGLFALREILFVLSVNAKPFSVRAIFFVHENFVKRHQTPKRPSSSFGGLHFFVKRENLLFRDSYPSTGHHIYRYHTKWYCVRDPIYRHLEMDRRGEMSDRDSDPAPFVRNSYIPETQQLLNFSKNSKQTAVINITRQRML